MELKVKLFLFFLFFRIDLNFANTDGNGAGNTNEKTVSKIFILQSKLNVLLLHLLSFHIR